MFTLAKIVSADDFESKNLNKFLDAHFRPDLWSGNFYSGHLRVRDGKIRNVEHEQDFKEWGEGFTSHLPHVKYDRFRYICDSTDAYSYQNDVGRMCQRYIWPAFFKSFPKGKILIVELTDVWWSSIFEGQQDLALSNGFDVETAIYEYPQEMSGLQTDNFPFSALNIAAFGIYPLILLDYKHTSGDLIFIYVPDCAFQHSQMTEPGVFPHLLWHLHHIFDDQWTFDGSRGPKSASSAKRIKPIEQIEYFSWLINLIAERMQDIISIKDALCREQLVMTFNRATCDGILSVSTQLPYMSKTFFFACLDKLANILIQINTSSFKNENEAWNFIISSDFLNGDLRRFCENIPCEAGKDMVATVNWVSEDFRVDKITPQILRDYRNSHHGYSLNPDIVKRLYTHSGEINNDITLLTTPLLLYTLSLPWQLRQKTKVKLNKLV